MSRFGRSLRVNYAMPYELIPMACAAGAAVLFACWAARTGSRARVVAGTALMFSLP
jgi:hypothetical protein